MRNEDLQFQLRTVLPARGGSHDTPSLGSRGREFGSQMWREETEFWNFVL
jgi:hypothetical protein